MRILYFHQYFSTPQGAIGTRSYEMARRLIARGHAVTMVCGSTQLSNTGVESGERGRVRRGTVDGIHVIEICLPYSNYDRLLKRSITFLRFACRSIWVAWRERYDVLFATSTPLTAAIPGIVMRLAKPRRKFVFEVRDLWPELPRAMGVIKNPIALAAMSVLEKMSYLAMHAGVALSPGIQAGMRRRTSRSKPIAMVPNVADVELFQPASAATAHSGSLPDLLSPAAPPLVSSPLAPAASARCLGGVGEGQGEGTSGGPTAPTNSSPLSRAASDRYLDREGEGQGEGTSGGLLASTGTAENNMSAPCLDRAPESRSVGLRCIFTGAHGLANGLDAPLDAAKELLARGRSDIHLIFIGDGKLKPGLVERSKREGLINCHFFDPIPKRQLSALMAQMDVGLMILANVPAFYYGTSPNKFFDYIAAGLPVVNNYPGWLADLLREHECGIAVPPDDPTAFADALVELADDPERRRRMGLNARRLAETHFNREILTNRFVDFLEQVADCGQS